MTLPGEAVGAELQWRPWRGLSSCSGVKHQGKLQAPWNAADMSVQSQPWRATLWAWRPALWHEGPYLDFRAWLDSLGVRLGPVSEAAETPSSVASWNKGLELLYRVPTRVTGCVTVLTPSFLKTVFICCDFLIREQVHGILYTDIPKIDLLQKLALVLFFKWSWISINNKTV